MIARGCPAILVGSSDANEDFPDLVVWQGHSYYEAPFVTGYPESVRRIVKVVALDGRVTTVSCSLSDPSSTDGQRVAPGIWPDGTATGLPKGTVLSAIRGVDAACALGTTVGQTPRVYISVDSDGTASC